MKLGRKDKDGLVEHQCRNPRADQKVRLELYGTIWMSRDRREIDRPEKGLRLVDLRGRRQKDLRSEEVRRTLWSFLSWASYRNFILSRLQMLKEYSGLLGRAKSFLVVVGIIFLTTIILAASGLPNQALFPAMIGFGLSLTGLLFGALPQLSTYLRDLSRHSSIAGWAVLTASFAFLGFSSTAVIAVVLFVGGLTAANVLWGLLPRILGISGVRHQRKTGVVAAATANPNPLLFTMVGIVAWSLGASFLMGFLRIHEPRPFGTAFLFAHVGLLLGLLPLVAHMLQEVWKPTLARWSLFRPRRLLRYVLFMTAVAALIGYEISIASDGGAFSGIPAFAAVLVLLSYLGVLARRLFFIGERLRPYHPLVLPAFGMVLLFAPMVVLLSNPPATITRVYGAAQAAGLAGGVAYIALQGFWWERVERLKARLQEAVMSRVPVPYPDEEPSDPYERIGGGKEEAGGSEVRVREVSSGKEEDEYSGP
ncbi:MAG: hypothetical protein V3W22_01630 [Thermoplasmata archaeon]